MYVLQRSIKSDLRPGIAGFEELLATVGFSGPVDRDIRDTLYELYQLRNVIMHQGGFADSRSVAACPRLGLEKGQKIKISSAEYRRYMDAVSEYVLIVINRVAAFQRQRGDYDPVERLSGFSTESDRN